MKHSKLFQALALMPLLLITGPVSAQNVNTVKDDPDRIRPIAFLLHPVFIDRWKTNKMKAGLDFGIDIHIRKYIDIHTVYRYPVWEETWEKGLKSQNKVDRMKYLEGTAGINVYNTYKEKSTKVVTRAYEGGSYTFENKLMKQRTSYCVRGGLIAIGTTYEHDDLNAFYLRGTGNPATDTAALAGKNYMDIRFFSVGISIKKIIYALTSIKGGKSGSQGNFLEMYADILPLMNLTMADELDPSSGPQKVKTPYTNKLGWRIGWRSTPSGRNGLTWGMEGGARPGPGDSDKFFAITPNSYFTFHFGLALIPKERFADPGK